MFRKSFLENAPGFCIDTDGIVSDLLKNLDEHWHGDTLTKLN